MSRTTVDTRSVSGAGRLRLRGRARGVYYGWWIVAASAGIQMLQAGLMQRVAPEPVALTSAQLLWMATRAGAEALSMGDEIGDFTTGKAADLVYIKPPAGTPLHAVLAHTEDPTRILNAVITLAGAESVCEVRVEGDVVYEARP